jgi:hypothetical protein
VYIAGPISVAGLTEGFAFLHTDPDSADKAPDVEFQLIATQIRYWPTPMLIHPIPKASWLLYCSPYLPFSLDDFLFTISSVLGGRILINAAQSETHVAGRGPSH